MTTTVKPPEASPDTEVDKALACDPRQQAGQDESIVERLAHDPASPQAKLDRALDESMDASDPPSQTPPGDSREPAPSSGYDETAEAALRRK
jgi:hypothetical protein